MALVPDIRRAHATQPGQGSVKRPESLRASIYALRRRRGVYLPGEFRWLVVAAHLAPKQMLNALQSNGRFFLAELGHSDVVSMKKFESRLARQIAQIQLLRSSKERNFTRVNFRAIRAYHVPIAESAIGRSEEHTSELQSLMRISYAVFCLKKKNKIHEQKQE